MENLIIQIIVQILVASGVIALIPFILRKIIDDKFDKKMRAFEGDLKLVIENTSKINEARREQYPKLRAGIRSARELCIKFDEYERYDLDVFNNIAIEEFEELYKKSWCLGIDKVDSQTHIYKKGLRKIYQGLIEYNSKIEEGDIESANKDKVKIKQLIKKNKLDGELLTDILSTLIDNKGRSI